MGLKLGRSELAQRNLLGENFSEKQITSIFRVEVTSTFKINASDSHELINNHLPENTL